MLAAHMRARRALPMLALILAPRHPPRGDAVAEMLRARGFQVAQRSGRRGRSTADTDVYLADTLGEMGLWYRIASVSFVGGSLVADRRPQPLRAGAARQRHPARAPCAQLPRPLPPAARGGRRGRGRGTRPRSPRRWSRRMAPDRAAAMAAAAWEACSEGAEVTDAVLDAIGGYLDRPR